MFTEQITERVGFCTPIEPQVLNNGNDKTGALDMAVFRRAIFAMNLGSVTGGGSVTFKLQESETTTDGDFSDVSGTTATMSVTTANKLYTLEIRADQLSSGQRYVRAVATETGSQNVYVQVTGWGDDCGYKPGKQYNAAAVSTQTVYTGA